MTKPLLTISQLNVSIKQQALLKDINLEIYPGECLGILGESGSGKSLLSKTIMGLLDRSFTKSGTISFEGNNLLQLSSSKAKALRGKDIALIMQQPMNCFDPLQRLGNQMHESLKAHKKISFQEAYPEMLSILETMSIRSPEDVLKKFPHQLSGGMLQRIMIGLALAHRPKLIIADEPTTAIDAITQYDIIDIFKKIKNDSHTSMLFISHDVGVIRSISDRIIVMNNGHIVDTGTFESISQNAKDSYTKQLLQTHEKLHQKYTQALYGGHHAKG